MICRLIILSWSYRWKGGTIHFGNQHCRTRRVL